MTQTVQATPSERLIDGLVADLRPVRPLRRGELLAALGGLLVVELALVLLVFGVRSDLGPAMEQPVFWWRMLAMAALAVVGSAATVAALVPTASPQRGLQLAGAVALVALVAGWFLDAMGGGSGPVMERLAPSTGLACMSKVLLLSVPVAAALGWLVRRGAVARPRGTALLAGLGAGAWGGFIYAWRCPFDDALYTLVWFTGGMGLATALSLLVLPRLARMRG